MNSRAPVNKAASARSFKRTAKKVKMANLAPPPMRGGYRL